MAAPEISLDFLRPPEGGWTAADLDHIPNLPRHTELLDGGLVFVSPQKSFHRKIINLLERELGAQAPAGHSAVREMTIWLDKRNRPEPDVVLLRPGTVDDDDTTWYPVAAVLLVVEVVSPDSVERDESTKPDKYARAGIPYFWRIDRDDSGAPVCYTYELDTATKAYQPAGVFHRVIETALPFPVRIDLDQR